MKIRTEAMSQT